MHPLLQLTVIQPMAGQVVVTKVEMFASRWNWVKPRPICCRPVRWTLYLSDNNCYSQDVIQRWRGTRDCIGYGVHTVDGHWTTANCWMGRWPSVCRWRRRRARYAWPATRSMSTRGAENSADCRQHVNTSSAGNYLVRPVANWHSKRAYLLLEHIACWTNRM